MRKFVLCMAIATTTLAGCGLSEPPACNNSEVLTLVEQLIEENAGAVFDNYYSFPRNDPMQMLNLIPLGIGMIDSDTFYIPKEQAEKITWGFSNTRTTALDDATRTRSCAVSVSFGIEEVSVGSFTLPYTVGFNDDGDVLVSL